MGLLSAGAYREELAQLLALVVGVWWVPRDVGWLAIEEVWHEHLVLSLLVAMGKDISSLESLWEEAYR